MRKKKLFKLILRQTKIIENMVKISMSDCDTADDTGLTEPEKVPVKFIRSVPDTDFLRGYE